jgi:hypothetical protein
MLRAGHPGGAVIGVILLLLGLAVAGIIVLGSQDLALSELRNQLTLDTAAVCFVAGVILVVRHIRAVAGRPQAIGGKSAMGTPGFEPGTKRL